MSTSPNMITSRCFARDYELGRSAAMRDLERSVLGCDYGGTSWTTRREAGRIAELLELRPGVRLLDVGAGSEFVDVDSDYALLLEQSGWHVQERVDVTAEFAKSLRTSLEGMKLGAGALIKVLGADEFSERVTRRQATLAAVDRGLLRREIFAAVTTTGAQSLAA